MSKDIARSYRFVVAQIKNAPHYFALLGVHRDSEDIDIRAARRALAKYVHPDINGLPEAATLMASVNKAADTLLTDKVKYLYTLGSVKCPICKGTGTRIKQISFSKCTVSACPECKGAGVLVK